MHLEVREGFPLRSGHPNLEINIFQITNAIILLSLNLLLEVKLISYPFLCHFYISCLVQPGIKETRARLVRVRNLGSNAAS